MENVQNWYTPALQTILNSEIVGMDQNEFQVCCIAYPTFKMELIRDEVSRLL